MPYLEHQDNQDLYEPLPINGEKGYDTKHGQGESYFFAPQLILSNKYLHYRLRFALLYSFMQDVAGLSLYQVAMQTLYAITTLIPLYISSPQFLAYSTVLLMLILDFFLIAFLKKVWPCFCCFMSSTCGPALSFSKIFFWGRLVCTKCQFFLPVLRLRVAFLWTVTPDYIMSDWIVFSCGKFSECRP